MTLTLTTPAVSMSDVSDVCDCR